MLDMLIAPNNTSLGALSGWTKWIGASDIVINSQNEARSDGGIVKYLNDVDLGSGGVDVSVPFRNTLANNGIGGVLIHSDPSNPSDGYFAYYSGGTLSLYKSVSNVSTLLGSSPLSVPAQIVGEEDYLRYTEDGAGNHEVFFAGESKITAVDTTYTSGQVGIRLDNADFRVASFEAIPFAGAGDTVKPVITLNAPAIVTLEIGDTYTQAPATATDNVDGSITVDVGGDTVVTTGVNSFTATFDATDAAGNVATQVTQTINVIEPISAEPAGVPVIGAYSVTDNSISVNASYAGSDATGLEWTVDGGTTAVAFTSPADLTGLIQDTDHPFQVRAVNGIGDGAWSAVTVIRTAVTVLVGVRGDAVPPPGLTGSHSASVIYKHLSLPAGNAAIWRAEAVAPFLAGFNLNQNGSYSVVGLLAGVHKAGYNVYKNNVLHAENQEWNININAS